MPKERSGIAAADTPQWREAFHDGVDYQASGDVDHVSRTVTDRLQQEWDRFSNDYQTGVTGADIRHLMKDYDWQTDELYGYVRTSNSFKINESLYTPENVGKTDTEIFTRVDRRGVKRDLMTVRTLDKLIDNHTTQTDATYTRFSSPAAIQATFNLSDAQINALQNAKNLSPAQLRRLNAAFSGKVSFSRGYTSTSANRSMNAFARKYSFERKLYIPKGTKGYAVKSNAQESEVIFGRKLQSSIMKITVADDGHIVIHEMYDMYRKR